MDEEFAVEDGDARQGQHPEAGPTKALKRDSSSKTAVPGEPVGQNRTGDAGAGIETVANEPFLAVDDITFTGGAW
ncbi:hypothetical protein [Streptomyces sp. NPDC050263]|uniref:hypothetical protein n=1 Tax=Streptomyces sp. NPDC050263 TaxID=3155037 RepID=UPI00344989BB